MDAQALLDKAEKTASGSDGLWNRLTGASGFQLEEAADQFIQAANAFRLAKDNISAGRAFERAAELQQKTDSRDEAANTLVEAFKSYRNADPVAAARMLESAIHLFTMRGQFRRAAQYENDLGALWESSDQPEKAVEAYENAGDWFFNDRAEALSSKAFLKVAELAALSGDYAKSTAAFERVIKQSLNSDLAKWSLKDYFFRATLVYLAQGDEVSAGIALDRFAEQDPSFASTKENAYLRELVAAAKDHDAQLFTDKLYEYDQFAKLDKWKIAMGLKIKQTLEAEEDDIL